MRMGGAVAWIVTFGGIMCTLGLVVSAEAQLVQGWVKGQGYGWIWGPNDEIGALNALTEHKVLAALSLPKQGKVYDLGVLYDRASFQWPGHSPAEIISFRTPEGIKRQLDLAFMQYERCLPLQRGVYQRQRRYTNRQPLSRDDGRGEPLV